MSSSGNSRFRLNEGDWICPDSQCGNVNFARRFTCNRCGKDKKVKPKEDRGKPLSDQESLDDQHSNSEKSSAPPKKKLGHEIGKAAAEKSRGLFSADDWQCGRCGNVNWARRQQCNMCNAPKFGEVEERTGLGGGYNERENVEYIEREESDGEFDDYGRKKKKFRKEDKESGDESDEKSASKQPKSNPKGSDLDEDRPRTTNLSKYKLDSGDEEDDDDDDDDDEEGDLSKYDLSGWGDDDDKDKEKEDTNGKKAESEKRKKGSSQSSSSSSEEDEDSQTKKSKRRKKRREQNSSSGSSSGSSSAEENNNKNHSDRNSSKRTGRSSRSRSSSGSSSSSSSSRSNSPALQSKKST